MKIIHCADLHLDSKMESNLDKEKAKGRKEELLHTFDRMIDYANINGVKAILISGDMFDTKNISARTRNTVFSAIAYNPAINFYYLKGNHDNDNFLSEIEDLPDNLKLFGDTWTSYEECGGKLVISGVELDKDNSGAIYNSLVLDANRYNIVMLHGQEAKTSSKDRAEVINLKLLRNKGIDYLALGHVHSFKLEELDSRGEYCYPGCLEGRGFDECGEHGFMLLDFDEESGNATKEFVPFAMRRLYEIVVDISGSDTTAQILAKTRDEIRNTGCDKESLIKIVLTGAVDVESEKDTSYLVTSLKDDFYFVKCYDETTLRINIEEYVMDESLKGEFVRQVMGDDSISEDDKKIIIRYGLQVLAGEEVQ